MPFSAYRSVNCRCAELPTTRGRKAAMPTASVKTTTTIQATCPIKNVSSGYFNS